NRRARSVVLKRFDPWLARRNELVARRWLPAIGLGDRCPRLLATAADPRGEWVWHVYEDLGEGAVDAVHTDPARVGAVVDLIGGPETLLHGDLWTTNTFVATTSDGLVARLIDWDHAAVGPASYDLSTFLYRFPKGERPWILEAYQRRVAGRGRRLLPARELNLLFECAEYVRYAKRVIWPAGAILQQNAAAGWERPAESE